MLPKREDVSFDPLPRPTAHGRVRRLGTAPRRTRTTPQRLSVPCIEELARENDIDLDALGRALDVVLVQDVTSKALTDFVRQFVAFERTFDQGD